MLTIKSLIKYGDKVPVININLTNNLNLLIVVWSNT